MPDMVPLEISAPIGRVFVPSRPFRRRVAAPAVRGWIIVAAVFLTHGALLGSTWALHAIALKLQEPLGLTREGIGLIMGLAFGGIYLGAPISGALGDRFGRTRVLAATYFGLAASYALWFVADGLWQFWVFAAVFGAANGASVVIRPAVTADYYEGPRLAGMIGITFLTSFAAAVAGSLLFGLGHDAFGSYEVAQVVAVAIGLIAAVMVLRLDRETRLQRVRPTVAHRT